MSSKKTKKSSDRTNKKIDYACNYPDISNVSSTTDSTGMMPTPPKFDEEYASYQELAGMQIPKIKPGEPSPNQNEDGEIETANRNTKQK